MPDSAKTLTIALAGNPNSGKTTLFNHITGSRQNVGNYPGVTVEKKDGYCFHDGFRIHIVDLPGTYSLTARSLEERAARRFILDEKPDAIVDILDASNIERNLYLYTQLMELNVPLILALNMSDMAKARGIEFDLERLSCLLGAPIVTTVGHKGLGIKELLDTVVAVATGATLVRPVAMNLGRDIEKEIERIQELIVEERDLFPKYYPRWLAIQLLENDREIWQIVQSPTVRAAAEQSMARIETLFGDHPEIVIADQRYGIISGACQEAIRLTVESRHTYSDRIDEILTNRVLGVPLFLLLMYVVFEFTFTVGEYPVNWLETGFLWLGEWLRSFQQADTENLLISLVADGIVGGVGGVIIFVPNIFLLFVAIAFLEDSGYMARAAFNMDRFMHRIGLHGKSFIPMLIGFGCSVPAILATRTLENRRDRLTTMMVIPLRSCGERLPIYMLFIPAFFPAAWQAPILWAIYLIGIVLAIVGARLLRGTIFRGENEPFIMELPPYRLPTWKGISIHVFERTWMYLKKAGTIILGFSVILWAMMSFPVKDSFERDYTAERARAEERFHEGIVRLQNEFHLTGSLENLEKALRGDTFSIELMENQTEPINRLIRVCLAIDEAQNAFLKTLENEDVRPHTLDHALLVRVREGSLAKVEKEYPDFYPAIVRFIEDVRIPYQQSILELERARHAERLAYSFAGRFGRIVEPALTPLGFDWKIGTALLGAFAAKEVFIAQLGIVYSLGEAEIHSDALREQLRDHYSPLAAFCIMLFCLIAMPCMATVAATRQESGSWKWAFLQLGGLTVVGYILTLTVYQIVRVFSLGV